MLVVFVVFGLVGWMFTGNPLQPAFGIFVLLPLIYAVMAEPIVRQAGTRILPYIALLWFAAALGVVLDYLWEMPWTGLAYKLGEIEIEGSREWTTFGVDRVAGFARASYEAADQLLLLALPLVLLGRSKILKLLIWTATGVLIYLTTTKKTGGAFLILTLLMPLTSTMNVPALFRRTLTASMPVLVAAVGIGLPISTFFVTYRLDLDSLWSQVLFASFEDRLTVVWPASLALALEHGSAVLGRGIGGIGAAQKYFEPLAFMPADNLFIYLYVTFGLLALAFVWVYAWNLAQLDPDHGAWSRLMWAVGIAVLLNGLTGNVMESPITATLLGISMAYAYAAARHPVMPPPQWSLRSAALASPQMGGPPDERQAARPSWPIEHLAASTRRSFPPRPRVPGKSCRLLLVAMLLAANLAHAGTIICPRGGHSFDATAAPDRPESRRASRGRRHESAR